MPMAEALPDVRFLLVGHVAASPGARQLTAEITARGLVNVKMVPRVPPSEVVPYLYAADCLLIPPSSKPLHSHRRTVLPLKTFLYLAAGRPIVAPDLGDLREVLTPDHDALLVPPDSPAAAAEALRSLLADADRRERLSANATATAEQYTWDARADKIVTFLQGLLSDQ